MYTSDDREELFEGFVFFKQKKAYEMRISDWSSDVCSSDLLAVVTIVDGIAGSLAGFPAAIGADVRRVVVVDSPPAFFDMPPAVTHQDRKSTRLNSSH